MKRRVAFFSRHIKFSLYVCSLYVRNFGGVCVKWYKLSSNNNLSVRCQEGNDKILL